MKHLAIIPARSGSKGLPDKNIKELNGRPLLAYSIDAAKDSGLFSDIMVSTDSEQYAEIAKKYGASVPFLRSEKMSSDEASSWDTVREVLSMYAEQGELFDTVCLLQPTSPLRTGADLQSAYAMLEEKHADAVISVCEAEHSPLWMNTLPPDCSMKDFDKSEAVNRQQLETYYRLNGAVYIVKTENVLFHVDLYKHAFAYVMPQVRSIDIDTELDFQLAAFLMNHTEV